MIATPDFIYIYIYIYINDLHNIQTTTDKHNHHIPWYSRESWDQKYIYIYIK